MIPLEGDGNLAEEYAHLRRIVRRTGMSSLMNSWIVRADTPYFIDRRDFHIWRHFVEYNGRKIGLIKTDLFSKYNAMPSDKVPGVTALVEGLQDVWKKIEKARRAWLWGFPAAKDESATKPEPRVDVQLRTTSVGTIRYNLQPFRPLLSSNLNWFIYSALQKAHRNGLGDPSGESVIDFLNNEVREACFASLCNETSDWLAQRLKEIDRLISVLSTRQIPRQQINDDEVQSTFRVLERRLGSKLPLRRRYCEFDTTVRGRRIRFQEFEHFSGKSTLRQLLIYFPGPKLHKEAFSFHMTFRTREELHEAAERGMRAASAWLEARAGYGMRETDHRPQRDGPPRGTTERMTGRGS